MIETKVADIAHLSQKITENIDIQAEVADEVHENVRKNKLSNYSAFSVSYFKFISRLYNQMKTCDSVTTKFCKQRGARVTGECFR